jgi:transforming growth factor-beta-induced protein
MKRTTIAAAAVATGLAMPASASAANIVETAAGDPRFDTLVSLVQQAGLADELSGDAKLTVFAPTDRAFKRVPQKTLDKLGDRPRLLKRVLLYHVAAGDLKAEDVVQRRRIRTLADAKVRVRVRDGKVLLNRRARVVQADVGTDNGTIHVINRVLLPPAR